MANLITLGRFILLIVLIVLVYAQNPKLQLVNCPLLVIIFVLDAVDGYIARKRNEASLFGAIFDIAIDRVVVNGYDEDLESVHKKVKLDREYIRKSGFRQDGKILFSTVGVVLKGEGAR